MENTCKKRFRFNISNLELASFPHGDLQAGHGSAILLHLQLSCSADVLNGGGLVACLTV